MKRVLLWAALALAAASSQAQSPARFSFAIVGDAPYNAWEESRFAQMLDEINQEDIAFVVHVGDIKSGASPCSDELYAERKRMFQASRHPFIFVPGDNDWTDCHRMSAGGYDPLERLAKLREVFHAGETSLGQRTLDLARQSAGSGTGIRFREYRENVRWAVDRVLFIGLNVPGSNNNFGRTREMNAEYEERSQANAEWLRQGFELARANGYAGVFVFIQANPDFYLSRRRAIHADGYAALKQQLLAHTLAFGKPVVLVHGDTHHHRVDQPLYDPATFEPVAHFTRIESYGSPFVDWIKVTVDPGDPKLIFVGSGWAPASGELP